MGYLRNTSKKFAERSKDDLNERRSSMVKANYSK